ncbi:MAG TPA: fructose-specific PTS transporter subunit EIIC [Nitriliruptorales bacterium]|nr:fructose-specific PTS transporter subunit EIIC [Nitriliruptorales bacterium]
MKFVAVTSCPTGIAHSEMAAEALEQAASSKGHDIVVEVQGASGAPPIDPQTIAAADAVIFAVDATVRDRDRFAHLPSVEVRTREAIDRAAAILDRAAAAAQAAPTDRPAQAPTPQAAAVTTSAGAGRGEEVRRWLMTGVSYMIPFVVAGGILIAIAFAVGGAVDVTEVTIIDDGAVRFPGDVDAGILTWLGAVLLTIGSTAFSMLVPILAGFIAYAMADRPGIAPGIVGGLIANEIGAGFLGGMVAGLLAGAIVNALKRIPVRGTLQRMMPILVYPLVGVLAVGGLMVLVVGEPVATANQALSDWLTGLSGTNQIVLGVLIGLMMAFDMGGPVNKVAYTFGIAALDAGSFEIMAAVMAAGMTPPLGMALATVLRPSLYNQAEVRAGEAAWIMGASFITEGAIPFAAADPLRVIPSLMAGSAITGALSLLFDATLRAPHGGVWVVGVIGNWALYLVAIAAGTAVTAVTVNVLKSLRSVQAEPARTTEGVTVGA